MKATRYLAMAAAALAFAACSNNELESSAPIIEDMKAVDFSVVVNKQTRAQIVADNLTTLYVTTTGTFRAIDGTAVTDPTLALTKNGTNWAYTFTDATHTTATAGPMYWPDVAINPIFKAWYYEDGADKGAFNNKTAEKDAVGAYTAIAYSGTGAQSVGLNLKHAVAKAEFKVKLLEKPANIDNKVKIDIVKVCLHNMNYQASAFNAPTSTSEMGYFTVTGTTHRDLLSTPASHSFISEPESGVAATAVDLQAPMFVLPQDIYVEDFTTATWNKPYISILAQVRIDAEDNSSIIFPKFGGDSDYAWIAVPLPSDFTKMRAHHKYIFTINLRGDLLGKVDRDQNPNGDGGEGDDGDGEPDEDGDDPEQEPSGPDTRDKVPDEDKGDDISVGNHSGFPLSVTITDVYDFEADGDYIIN